MQVKYAENSDKNQIIQLWQECFDDSKEEICQYIDRYFSENRVLTVRDGENIIAMAWLFDICAEGQSAVYVFALGVKRVYRSRGIAGALLNEIQISTCKPIYVQPEKNGVEKFYVKNNFEKISPEKFKNIIEQNNLQELTLGEFFGFYRFPQKIFTPVMAEDLNKMEKYLRARNNVSCDSLPYCTYLLRNIYPASKCLTVDCCYIIYRDNSDNKRITASIPACDESVLPKNFIKQQKYFNLVLNKPHILYYADDQGKRYLSESGSLEDYDVILEPDHGDYIYSGNDLRTLSGKKFSKKRNLINQFLRENVLWEYRRLNGEDIDKIEEFLSSWRESRDGVDEVLDAELKGISDIVESLNKMQGLHVGGIEISGKLRAIAIGGLNLRHNMAIIDVEKADKNFVGLYQMINREFLINEFPDAEYVNREDDAGLPELRKAKLSYNPLRIEEKFSIIQKEFK